MKTLIIDDEPLAREGLADYLKQVSYLELYGLCESPMEAIGPLASGEVDLMLLDIQMPGITGLDFLKSLEKPPITILTTAYPSYALEGYQLDVLDYLVKPITFQRFLKAVNKAHKQWQLELSVPGTDKTGEDHFFVKVESQYEKIRYDDILFVEALQNYVCLYTASRKYTSLLTMKAVEEALPNAQFMRVHRSYIVALDKIETLKGYELLIGEHRVPVSRSHREEVHKKVVQDRLLG
ncbi:MAG: LytR/AlgR family response regulator transcription factor [Bacteroidia bacterium]